MIRCDVILLSAYVDNELTLPERRRLEAHLAVCAACRSELEAIQRTDRMIRSWAATREPVPVITERRVLASTEKKTALSSILALSRVMPAALGSSIAALLVLASVNAGLVAPQAAPRTNSGPSRSVLVKRSAPLVNARRVSAILGSRPTGQGAEALPHHTHFDIQ